MSSKTEVLHVWPWKFVLRKSISASAPSPITQNHLQIALVSSLTNIWILNKLIQSCFLHRRNIAKIKPLLSFSYLRHLVHILIFSHFDYCNSVFIYISQFSIACFQLVQNGVGVTKTWPHSRIISFTAFQWKISTWTARVCETLLSQSTSAIF